MCCTSKIGVPKFRGKLISTSVKATGPPVDAPIITTSRRLLRLGCAGGGAGSRRGGDRKSTRLNSSHVAISYAVFFLIKKKKEQDHDHDPTLREDEMNRDGYR